MKVSREEGLAADRDIVRAGAPGGSEILWRGARCSACGTEIHARPIRYCRPCNAARSQLYFARLKPVRREDILRQRRHREYEIAESMTFSLEELERWNQNFSALRAALLARVRHSP